MYADHIPKATSLLADVIAVLRPPGDEEEPVGTTFCFLGGRMHVSGKAAAKDLDYSQGLNFILPSFSTLPALEMEAVRQASLLQRYTSQHF